MKPDQKTSWSLTGLACEFGFEFRTAMAYRSGYLKIPPDTKVPGVSKRQFSRSRVGEFLIARRLFGAGMPAAVVQAFLDFVRECRFLEVLFDHPEIPSADKLAASTFLLAFDPAKPAAPYFISSDAVSAEKFRESIDLVIRAEWTFTMLSLASVVDELNGRLRANSKCIEYRPLTAGDKVRAALLELAPIKD
jgi:hypothetical protein